MTVRVLRARGPELDTAKSYDDIVLYCTVL